MLIFLLACARHPVQPAPLPRPAHSGDVTAARDALVTADLPRFHAAMQRTGAGFPIQGQPAGAQERVVQALARAQAAPTLSDAALAFGALAGECASCHVVTHAEVPGPSTEAVAGDGVRAEMARHDRALGLIWSGLVRPSETDLQAGASAFAASTLAPRSGGSAASQALDDAVTQLARDLQTSAPVDRGQQFAALVGTCAGCHTAPPAGLEGEPE